MDGRELVRKSRVGHIAHLELNDPDVRNALTLNMRRDLRTCLEDFGRDPSVRAIVLSGAGTAFCAGGDLRTLAQETLPSMLERQLDVQALVRLFAEGSKPIIAAVEGAAVGAGLSIAAACDIVVAGSGAKFGSVFGKVGLAPDLGLSWTLPRRVGIGRAKLMALTGRMIPASLAYEWGLVDEIVAAGATLSAARTIAEEIAGNAPLAVKLSKRALDRSGNGLSVALDSEATNQTLLAASQDFREGYEAFGQKRTANFTGN